MGYKYPNMKNIKTKIVVIGGGTGTFTVLTGLRKFRKENNLELSAVVSMADDGGSTGVLRDELGVLPPGDIRQCLVALSTSDNLMRDLMNYRFDNGTLKGHNFGNLLLSALEKVTGGFDEAVTKVSEILRCEGKIIPVTLKKVTLKVKLKSGQEISGQQKIFQSFLTDLEKIYLAPTASANTNAVEAVLNADAVVIGPGEFYTSVIPNLLVKGIPEALQKTKAKKIYVCNLMKRREHTNDFSVQDFTNNIEKYIGCEVDAVIYNNKRPSDDLMRKYSKENEFPVEYIAQKTKTKSHRAYVGGDLLNTKMPIMKKGDPIKRNLIRHNPERLAKIILKLLNR